MALVSTVHKNIHGSPLLVRSKKVSLGRDIDGYAMISGRTEYILDVLEKEYLESISDINWNNPDVLPDFSFFIEKYNKFLYTFSDKPSLDGIHIVFLVFSGPVMTFAHIGSGDVLMIEKNEKITPLTTTSSTKGLEFSHVSSGEIPTGAAIYVSNHNILGIVSREDLSEISRMDDERYQITLQKVLDRSAKSTTHMVRVVRGVGSTKSTHQNNTNAYTDEDMYDTEPSIYTRIVAYVSPVCSSTYRYVADGLSTLSSRVHIPQWIARIGHDTGHEKQVRTGIFAVGCAIALGLLYTIFSSIFITSPDGQAIIDEKNTLISTQTLVEDARKNMANPIVFNEKIAEAEKILLAMAKDEKNIGHAQTLLTEISTLRKEVYGIETLDLASRTPIVTAGTDFSIVRTLELDKKRYIVGKNGIMGPILDTTKDAKIIAYPPGEIGIDADIAVDGTVYVLTTEGKVLSYARNVVNYVKINGQDGWGKPMSIKSFNGNIYLLDTNGKSIYKHKPGVNGYGPRAVVTTRELTENVVDIAIDGGFFGISRDGKIQRIISSPYSASGMQLNGLPGIYETGASGDTMSIYTSQNINYIYTRSGHKIWIWKPDTKNYKDLKSLSYVGEIQVTTSEDIAHIYVPIDGTILLSTATNIYKVIFEVVDGKVVFKG